MAGDVYGLTGFQGVSLQSTGQSVSPVLNFSSETSLGFYRSAASTIALSYGTLVLPSGLSGVGGGQFSTVSSVGTLKVGNDAWFGSGISVGSSSNTGTEIQAISAISLAMPAHAVQGSASSFTLFAWPAVRPLDAITVAPLGAAISSISSGLVFHSHCTVAGQVEIRISNVSTLVQNQSAITLALYRLSAF